MIEATLNGARTPQTTTAKQLWNGAGKTELAFVGISEIAGYTVSLRLSVGPTRFIASQLNGRSSGAGKHNYRALSPARHVPEDTPHQTRPKIDAGDALFAYGSIN